ncbi:MAG: hypothetical protein H7263_16230 [Candidatus Sericytochromatia bacterium]|nr:hypothetical protein [Candidatus Sericytochromatia bacterium]
MSGITTGSSSKVNVLVTTKPTVKNLPIVLSQNTNVADATHAMSHPIDFKTLSKNPTTNKIIKPIKIVSQQAGLIESTVRSVKDFIGTTQTVVGHVRGFAKIEENAGKIIKVASKIATPLAKPIASLEVFNKFEKVITNPVLGKVFGFVSIVTGGFDIKNGITDISNGKKKDGGFKIVSGTAGVVGGVALIVGAAPVAAVAGAVVIGVSVVKYGDESTKKLGWLKDKNGNAQSSFDRLGDRATDIGSSVEKKTGSVVLGTVAKYGSGVIMVPAATVVAVSGAVVNGTKTVGGYVGKAWDWATGK